MGRASLVLFSVVLVWEVHLNQTLDLQVAYPLLTAVSSVSVDDSDTPSYTLLSWVQVETKSVEEVVVCQEPSVLVVPVGVEEALEAEVKVSRFRRTRHCERTPVGCMGWTPDTLDKAAVGFLNASIAPIRCYVVGVAYSLLGWAVVGLSCRTFSYQAEAVPAEAGRRVNENMGPK